MTPQQTAEAVRDLMLAQDSASRSLGMEVIAIAPGTATLAMTVRDDMLNGFGSCHGGLIATLADSAFAFACNSRNERTVASGFSIDIVAPGRRGDRLTAVARELQRGNRTGLYDITVRNQRDELVAEFRGKSYALKGQTIVEGAAP
jgi:acyl-CoA thioesterase